MKVSVVIPTYNRIDDLRKCLNALRAQTLDRGEFEVIVVDDGSKDSTPLFMEGSLDDSGMNLSYYRQDNRGPASARN
ncbi:MAG: glycosyltransferase family A protein, partial [Candidatus Micrarchaeota archaeon]|nr:glycosyltransferase family A protein [Candidatus Micrarchaeota archaeon]